MTTVMMMMMMMISFLANVFVDWMASLYVQCNWYVAYTEVSLIFKNHGKEYKGQAKSLITNAVSWFQRI